MSNISTRPYTRDITPELPLTASQAAIQIDNLLLKQSKQTDAIERLAQILERTLGETDSTTGTMRLAIPGSIEIFTQTLSAIQSESKLETIEDLVNESKTFIDLLTDNVVEIGEDHLCKLREFCASLALAASSYLMQRRHAEPMHPYQI